MDYNRMGKGVKKAGNTTVWFIFIVVCFFIFSMLAYQVADGYLGGKSPQTPVAQEAYDGATYTQCLAHKALGNAKLGDYFDGFLNATDEEVLRWKEAREQDCSLGFQ